MFERESSEPIYNTQAVVQRTGVPADTFRAWERRFSVPTPARDASNRRLYSEVDISLITWLRDQTRTGVTISQAISIFASQSPPLGSAVKIGSVAGESSPFARLRVELARALIAFDGKRANQIVQESLSICSVDNVCAELLYGAYCDVREQCGCIETPGCAQYARSFVQRKLAALFDQSDPDSGRASVLVAGLEDDSHEIELLLTSLLLSRSGARVAYLGVNVDRESLRCAIATSQPRLALIAPPPSGVPVDPSLQDRSGRQITVALASDGASAPGDRVLMVGRDPIAAFARVSELLSTRR